MSRFSRNLQRGSGNVSFTKISNHSFKTVDCQWLQATAPMVLPAWGIRVLGGWLCEMKIWVWASDITRFISFTYISFLMGFRGNRLTCQSCGSLLLHLHLPRPRVGSQSSLKVIQITVLRVWTTSIGKISFYSMVLIQSLACLKDWGWAVEKSSWSERVQVQKVVSGTEDRKVFDTR